MSRDSGRRGSGKASLTNLPPELTSFVGRVRELEDAKRMLSDSEIRLLTLVGPVGCGKTRLALRVARGLEGSFSDDVWWVELASLFEPGLVSQRVARTPGGARISGRRSSS